MVQSLAHPPILHFPLRPRVEVIEKAARDVLCAPRGLSAGPVLPGRLEPRLAEWLSVQSWDYRGWGIGNIGDGQGARLVVVFDSIRSLGGCTRAIR